MRALFASPPHSRTLALAAGVFALGVAAPVAADDLSLELPVFGQSTFSMTSTTTARYRGQNYDNNPFDDDFASIQQRFDLALQGGELRLEVRLDTFIPFAFDETVTYRGMMVPRSAWFGSAGSCPEAASSFCYLAWDLRPERIVLRWDHESWSVELGDAQLVIGRGAALSFRKVDLLGVDTSLRGAHVRYDDGHFRARLHAGIANPQNQDPITLGIFQDPIDFERLDLGADLAVAGSVGATFGPDDAFVVSGHAVHVGFQNERNGAATGRAVDILGWTMEAPALADGHLALYAEANGMRRSATLLGVGEEHEFGRSVYGSAQLQLDNLTVLVEWKDYRNFLVAPSITEDRAYRIYSAAPSLEFDGPQRLRAIGNQRGGSVRIDYGFAPGPWQFSVNGSVYGLAEAAERDPWDGILVTHGWLTLQRRLEYNDGLNWSINASAGFRQESIIQPEEFSGRTAGEMDRRTAHGMIDVTLGEGEHSFDVVVDHRFEQEHPGGGTTLNEFQVGGASVTYTYNVRFSATLMLRWSDFVANEVMRRGQQDYNFLGGDMYPSIELRWNFDPGTFVRGFFGSTPGGVICSGGVCRQVPPYEGALLQFVARI
jgi:hypothetical protein